MKLTGVAAGIVAVVALAGCGGGSGSQKGNADKDYLSVAYAAIGGDVAHSSSLDKALTDAGHQLCTALGNGTTWTQAQGLLDQGMAGTTPAQNTLLMAAAVGAYCPSHKGLAPSGTFDS